MHGSKDTLVSPEQSAKLFRMLKKNGDNAEYVLVEGAEHGDNTWYQPIIINRVVEWFTKTWNPIKPLPNNKKQTLTCKSSPHLCGLTYFTRFKRNYF